MQDFDWSTLVKDQEKESLREDFRKTIISHLQDAFINDYKNIVSKMEQTNCFIRLKGVELNKTFNVYTYDEHCKALIGAINKALDIFNFEIYFLNQKDFCTLDKNKFKTIDEIMEAATIIKMNKFEECREQLSKVLTINAIINLVVNKIGEENRQSIELLTKNF